MRVCLVLEGSYPYVYGGVSTWMHGCIRAMPEHEFVLWVIGAKAADRGKFVYELPANVAEVHEVFLDDALRLRGGAPPVHFTPEECAALRELVRLGAPDWEVLFRLFSQDDAVVAVGVGMMHVLTPVYITYVCIEVLAGALRGCGDVRVPTLITVFFVCGLRMLWLFIAVPIRHEVATVEMSYPITWSLASALFILYYVKGGWMQRCAEKWEKKQAG